MQHNTPIETDLGYIRGRDALFLRQVRFENRTTTLILEGAINAKLCSKSEATTDYDYRLRFINVLALKMIELDSWHYTNQSSFDEILDSDWIRQLRGKVTSDDRHFVVQTYDDVFEVVCEHFDFEVMQSES